MEYEGVEFKKRHQKGTYIIRLSYSIEEESALVDDPLFSNSAVDEYIEKLVKPSRKN